MTTCGSMFAKIVLIIFNIIFLLGGFCLIGVGGWVLGDKNITTPFEISGDILGQSFLRNAAILLISIGILVVLFTIFGMYAAISEKAIALSIYIAMLVLICFGEIAGGVVAIIFKDEMIENLNSGMSSSLIGLSIQTEGKFYNGNCSTVNNAVPWDFFQFNGACCGLDGPGDYKDVFNYQINLQNDCKLTSVINNEVPWSCCEKKGKDNLPIPAINDVNCSQSVHPQGCYLKLVHNVQKYAPILIGIGLGFGFLELFGIIFAVCVCQNPSKDY